jgi:hypothetical protein
MNNQLLILAVVILIVAFLQLTASPLDQLQLGGDSELYYQQHRRYPADAWWISYSDPRHKCHLQARMACHGETCYDTCYESVLSKCTDPYGKPPNIVSFKTKYPLRCGLDPIKLKPRVV